jgi:hypothetical protein
VATKDVQLVTVSEILQIQNHPTTESARNLSTVLDDFSRYILAWKLCTT